MTDWTNKTLLELIKLAATSIDFDQLIADGAIVMLTAHSKATDVYSNAQSYKFILRYAKWKASQN
jgi:hypothetical protein